MDGTNSSERMVSIILPTHNREKEISRAIRSVLEQSHSHFELIVVDDGSTDGTAAVVESFDDRRIRYIKHGERRGGGAARNTGIQAARHDYIAFQDSDDEWLPHKLATQVQRLERAPGEIGAVYCGYIRVDPGRSQSYFPQQRIRDREGDIHAALLRENFVGTPTLLVRRQCFERIGLFDERLPRFQDWELMIRLAAAYRVGFISEPLLRAYYADDNISSAHDRSLAEAEALILEKHAGVFAAAGGEILSYRLWHLAHLWFMCGEMAKGRKALRRATKVAFRAWYLLLFALSWNRLLYKTAYGAWSLGRAADR
jgi:glycosyltransferase involved in cell wall biosynthesis